MKQFDVYIVDLNPTQGSEINKVRPAVIISPDVLNKYLNTVLIAPLTHKLKGYPSRVASRFAGREVEIVLDQIRAVDKLRLKIKQRKLDPGTAANVKKVLITMFS
ncbi:MAG TPA: type II toxin-antitoxin system PemK/MazF family toxin [Chitinophagaceae bacterium]